MGFNFQAGHPSKIFEPSFASRVERALKDRFGASVPLGKPGAHFCLREELGWPWWEELQTLARETLGQDAARQIAANEAWQAAYVDAEFSSEELVLPDDPDAKGKKPGFRIESTSPIPPDLLKALQGVGEKLAASKPSGPEKLQIASLRGLKQELDALFTQLGTEPTKASITALMRSYVDDDDRVDDDPAIQCACHAWLTADRALSMGAPLWLVK